MTTRAEVITKRTYCRPKKNGKFEEWEEVVNRAIQHQAWLWDRALGKPEAPHYHAYNDELNELRNLMLERKVSLSGRTLWLGGTEVAKARESSQFNCSFARAQTIHDMVDIYWLLLQGCGVGFYPSIGTLSGFSKYIPELEIVPGKTNHRKGPENSLETFDSKTGVWRITIGDSAEAWAKSLGKILAGKHSAKKLVLDFSRIRGAGFRLSGYGWLSVGFQPLASCLTEIYHILNRRSAQLLTEIDILDIINHVGTTISTRRSAEIAVLDYNSPNWKLFANAKSDLSVETGLPHRMQSNNSLIFWNKPTKEQLDELFNIIRDSGGSEPGFINGEAARRRAPWFKGVNPCGEILLGDKTFCNLVEVNLSAFRENRAGLERAIWLVARANYRQTCVDLDDGVLQRTWHENNEFLRLCGVGLTGLALCPCSRSRGLFYG
jgi:ribonucleoside-triphosphate reductase